MYSKKVVKCNKGGCFGYCIACEKVFDYLIKVIITLSNISSNYSNNYLKILVKLRFIYLRTAVIS